jgi:hypothetical protein
MISQAYQGMGFLLCSYKAGENCLRGQYCVKNDLVREALVYSFQPATLNRLVRPADQPSTVTAQRHFAAILPSPLASCQPHLNANVMPFLPPYVSLDINVLRYCRVALPLVHDHIVQV